MKRCPKCRRDYYDDTLSFCLDDGTPLVQGPATDELSTRILPRIELPGESPTQVLHPRTSNSIAVLPFANMSADAENEYFCDGLAEEILNALSRIEDLKVAARTSAFSFKGRHADIGEVGKTLNVNNVLEGSVRKSGDRLRITVQLINVSDGYHLWSERYDRDMKGIFDLQDEIALAVVSALKVKLLGEEKAAMMKRYTENTEVYELYLKGRYCLNSDFLNKGTQNEVQKAIGYFEEAIGIDKNYAPAFAGLADAYTRLLTSGDAPPIPPVETMSKAREAAQKALALDNDLSEAHAALGIILCVFDYDFAGAEREYKLAVELKPNYAGAHERYAGLLAALGRHEEAEAEYRRALEIDPISFGTKMKYCQFLFLARRYDESIAELKKILELKPDFPIAKLTLAVIHEAKGEYAEAIEEIADFQERFGVYEHAAIIRESFAKGGWPGFLKERMAYVSQEPNLPAATLASLYATAGENDRAFAELDKAYENREPGLANLKVDPNFDNLRDDPRFQVLLDRVGFPA